MRVKGEQVDLAAQVKTNTKMIKIIFLCAISFGIITPLFAQKEEFKNNLAQIAAQAQGEVGIAIMDVSSRETVSIKGDDHFPMQSVYKFPLAMKVLDEVDKGHLTLDQKMLVKKEDLLAETWSPMKKLYPEGNVEIPLSEIIGFTVSQSDNNGCDFLFRLVGGPTVVNDYIHSLGIEDISIRNTEEEMQSEEQIQFLNWSSPLAMLQILDVLYQGIALSQTANEFLMKCMIETSTGPNKIKGLLPSGTIVAHKTGASGVNAKGITNASNDVGILHLPNGKKIILVVFVSKATADEKTIENVIAQISKATYDEYLKE
jgi:beta-lactamase class A